MSEKKYTDNLKHEYLLSKLKLFEAIVKAARKRAPKKLYIHLKKKKEQIQLKRRMNYEKCSKDKGFRGGGQSNLSTNRGIGAGQAPFGAATQENRKRGFTLAEVLITLGVIGVVAAMTLPALIQKNNNKVVETRLQKFYSAFNQAILMAEKDYGDKSYWYEDLKGAEKDEEGNIIEGSSAAEKWFNKYLKPYLNLTRTDTLSDGSLMIYFADGSALRPAAGYTRDWYFYPGDPKKCIAKYGESFSKSGGICLFVFNFYPASSTEQWRYHYKKGMEPYKAGWNGDINKLYEGSTFSCKTGNRHYCTAIIQDNGWKIPDDYPYKVSY